MVKLSFYVPATHVDQVKNALFAEGVGKIGEYDCCAWQTLGVGQFRPLSGSQPFIGQQGNIETVEEYLVEMICDDSLVDIAQRILLESHPYEEPAYGFYPMLPLSKG